MTEIRKLIPSPIKPFIRQGLRFLRRATTLLSRNFHRVVALFASDDYAVNLISNHAGSSSPFGKEDTARLIEQKFPDKEKTRILDVGPGRGTYYHLLSERSYRHIDAVEIYEPYIRKFRLRDFYETVFHSDVRKFQYEHYHVILFGDVLEHIAVADAQRVLSYAQQHSDLTIVAVPYLLPQLGGQLDGSGDHLQEDLTYALFLERYPGFQCLTENDSTGIFYSD